MTKKKRANACRDHLYGGSEGGLPPPFTSAGMLSLASGALNTTVRFLALLAPFVADVRRRVQVGDRDGVAAEGAREL